MKRSVGALALAIVLSILVQPAAAYAAWNNTASGTGLSQSVTVGLPTSTGATSTGATSIHISWAAPTAPSAAPTQYVVRRQTPTTLTVCTTAASVLACDDTGLTVNTTYTYTVEARVGSNWASGQTPAFGATTTNQTFVVTPSAGTHTAGVAFNLTITATTNGVTTDTSYTGSHAITFSGPTNSPNGATPTYPATVNFVAGVGTASITLVNAATATLLTTDGVRTGSASITVVAGAPAALAYTNSTPPCPGGSVNVGNGNTFTSFVSVVDSSGNTATASALTTINITKNPAAVGTLAPTSLTIAAGASQTAATFTFKLPVGNPPDTTVTSAAAGLTSVSCIVGKH